MSSGAGFQEDEVQLKSVYGTVDWGIIDRFLVKYITVSEVEERVTSCFSLAVPPSSNFSIASALTTNTRYAI